MELLKGLYAFVILIDIAKYLYRDTPTHDMRVSSYLCWHAFQ